MKPVLAAFLIAILLSWSLPASAGQGFLVMNSKQRKVIRTEKEVQSFYDVDGDGFADVLDVDQGDTFLQATSPRAGQFTKLRIRTRKKNSLQVATFALTPDGKRYLLTGIFESNRPKSFAQDVVVGICPDRNQVTELQKQVASLTSDLQSSDRLSALQCQIQRTSSTLFDASCADDVFSKSLPAMMGAYSSLVNDINTVDAKPSSREPQFFQCLDKLQLGEHTSRIAAYLGRSMSMANLARVFRSFSGGPERSTGNEWNVCAPDKAPSAAGLLPPIKCQAMSDPTFRGEYDPINSQITLRKPIKDLGVSSLNQSQYKSVLFHELLHASGIDDEKLTGALETCCVQGLSDSNPACKTAKERRNEIVRIQNHYESFEKNFPGFPALRAQLVRDLDPIQAEALLNIYFARLRETIKTAEAERATCRASAEFCESRVVDTVVRASSEFFKNECGRLIDKAGICQKADIGFSNLYRREMLQIDFAPMKTYDVASGTWLTTVLDNPKVIAGNTRTIWEHRDADTALSYRAFLEAQSDVSVGIGGQRPASNPEPIAPVDGNNQASAAAITPVDMVASPISMTGDSPRLGEGGNRSDIANSDSRATALTDGARVAMRSLGSAVSIPRAEARSLNGPRDQQPSVSAEKPAPVLPSVSILNPFDTSAASLRLPAASIRGGTQTPLALSRSMGASQNVYPSSSVNRRIQSPSASTSQSSRAVDPKGSRAISELSGRPFTGTAGSNRSPTSPASRTVAGEDALPSEYQSQTAMAEFLVGPYAPIVERLDQTDFRRSLNRFRLSIQTRESNLIGSSKPERCFNYSARSQRLVTGECR